MEKKKIYNFNEKAKEHVDGKDLEVWQSPKYLESKNKVIEMLDSGKYNLNESDFWILMNKTKTEKMAYTGLIISHNGCLKINDSLEINLKFKPSCVIENQNGYEDSLVYTYINDDQGIYEVGEISKSNYTQNRGRYPYAMAYKRLFDRVVLKNSKLAFAGVYSDSEADEFKEPIEETTKKNSQFNNISQDDNDETKIEAEFNSKLAESESDLDKVLEYYKLSDYSAMTIEQKLDSIKTFNKKIALKGKKDVF